jgi:hypothetical protein
MRLSSCAAASQSRCHDVDVITRGGSPVHQANARRNLRRSPRIPQRFGPGRCPSDLAHIVRRTRCFDGVLAQRLRVNGRQIAVPVDRLCAIPVEPPLSYRLDRLWRDLRSSILTPAATCPGRSDGSDRRASTV